MVSTVTPRSWHHSAAVDALRRDECPLYWQHCYINGRVDVTIPRLIQSSPHKRARIRAFFANRVDKLHLPWVIEALPTLLHLSLSLFLAGLLIFLPVHYQPLADRLQCRSWMNRALRRGIRMHHAYADFPV